MEIINSGWLTKSPPESKMKGRGPFKSQWRRRYFVLFGPPASASTTIRFMPGSHAVLDYYENQDMLKKKGSIDLKNCIEVRDRLDSVYYKHLFSLHTNIRTYYLAAESEADMDKWVDHLIHILALNGDTLSSNISSCVTSSPQIMSPSAAPLKSTGVNGSQNSQNLPSSHLSSLSFSPGSDRIKKMQPADRQFSASAAIHSSQSVKYGEHQLEQMFPRLKISQGMESLNEVDNNSEDDDSVYNRPTDWHSHKPDNNVDQKTPALVKHDDLQAQGSSDYDLPPHFSFDCHSTPDDIYDIPPPSNSDDIYDHPPPSAHSCQGQKMHGYINAPSKVCSNAKQDETYDSFPSDVPCHCLTKSEESSSEDDAENYEQYGSQPCPVSVTSRTRSFRSSTVRQF